jgi:4a-hydroxytetrahydrobiopterin dehydratase
MARLTGDVLQKAFEGLDARWRLEPAQGQEAPRIGCELTFANFRQAFAFMTEVALLAERADHHPEWFNVYNRVNIRLTTHDAAGITSKDIELARAIDELCKQYLR